MSAIIALIGLTKLCKNTGANGANKKQEKERKSGRGDVDKIFFERIKILLKIVLPSFKCSAIVDIICLTVFLIFRTYLSIYLAGANGRIVKAIIKLDFKLFVSRVTTTQ